MEGEHVSNNRSFAEYWSSVDGAKNNLRKRYLRKNDVGVYRCPIHSCEHPGFKSNCDSRKHIDQKHSWYYYLDHEPFDSSNALKEVHHKPVQVKIPADTAKNPCFLIHYGVGQEFSIWLSAACGGGMSRAQAKQIATRVMKFLKYCNKDDEDELSTECVVYCLGSPSLITKFVEYVREEWKLSNSAQINYLQAIYDMIDYPKSQGISECASQFLKFTVTGQTHTHETKVVGMVRGTHR